MSLTSYRPDIDGLRAVAVLSVVISHGYADLLPSGFLGVDVFFVISGFVITNALASRQGAPLGAFIADFFSRRVKRLLPALAFCVVATGSLVLIFDATPARSLSTAAYAMVGVSNISLFAQELDYFGGSVKFNAFTHTWSLGVEEQFYVLFPILFWMLNGRKDRRGRLTLAILTLSIFSLAAFVVASRLAPIAAYYLTPMRLWELGAGVLAAQIAGAGQIQSLRAALNTYSPVISYGLLAGLVAVFFLPDNAGPYSNISAVAITTLLIVLGVEPKFRSVILINNVATYIGKISYSLYLWHWPYLTLGLVNPGGVFSEPLVAIAAAAVAAVFSYHCIEKRFRYKNWHSAKAIESLIGATIAAIIAVSIGLTAQNAFSLKRLFWTDEQARAFAFPPNKLPVLGNGSKYNPTCVVDDGQRPLNEDTIDLCTAPPTGRGINQTIWAMGDSHVGHLQGLLYGLHEDYGLGVHLIETPGHQFPSTRDTTFGPRQEIFDDIKGRMKPGDVILLSRLYLKRESPPVPYENVDLWTERILVLADAMAERGVSVIVVGPPPMFLFDDVRECSVSDASNCLIPRATLEAPIAKVHAALNAMAAEHSTIFVFELFNRLCAEGVELCSPLKEGVFLYRDRDHFNAHGSAQLRGDFGAFLKNDVFQASR
ncbi:MAG: acyltransferase family protein [Pseudomonadota bacterium]